MIQYEMFELVFTGEAPQNEAAASVTATFGVNGKTVDVHGFYAGNNTYKVRYYPREAGEVTWEVTRSDVELAGMLTGSETCEAAPGATRTKRQHGIVRANALHFAYDDGTRFVPFGTTVYALIHQPKELVDTTFKTLAESPFNKVRFCIFPKDYSYNHNEPEYFAFHKTGEKFDVSRPCHEYWEQLESRLVELDGLGIQADIIIFHPYDRWGFSKLTHDECMVYLGYLVRRLSAFPNVWWSLANEYDLMDAFERPWWDEFARFIAENDPFRHLLSNHNCFPYWDFSNGHTTHCSIQDINVNQVSLLQKQYGKPVVFDELCYEGNIEFAWGNISGFEMTHRFWTATILGAYCTHGETFLSNDEVLWWAKGGVLKGKSPQRIAFLKDIMAELPSDPEPVPGFWDRLTPETLRAVTEEQKKEHFLLKGLCAVSEERLHRFVDKEFIAQSRCGDDVFLRYYGKQCVGRGEFELPENGSYDIEVIDVWEMTRTTVKTGVGGKVSFELPSKEGVAVIAWKKRRP